MYRIFVSLILLTLILTPVYLFADIINIPEDFEAIQDGIDEAEDGDTVLVADGEYTGEGNTELQIDNEIFLLSEGGPENCIINCEEEARSYGIRIYDAGVVSGFTVTGATSCGIKVDHVDDFLIDNCIIRDNAASSRYNIFEGGGILIRYSEGTVNYCIITNNSSYRDGGGVFLTNSEVDFVNCEITDNLAYSDGGGIYCDDESQLSLLKNCLITGNESNDNGGGVALFTSNTMDVRNCTFSENRSDNGGAIYKFSTTRLRIFNSIFWQNQAVRNPHLLENRVDMLNCLVENGWDDGENIIDEYPLFVTPALQLRGNSDYFLDYESPCIDAGNESAEEHGFDTLTTAINFKTDTGVVDIGFHYWNDEFPLGKMYGSVTKQREGTPLNNVSVRTSNLQNASTDSAGNWEISPALGGNVRLTFSKDGYVPSVEDTILGKNDTLSFEVQLMEIGFELSQDSIVIQTERLQPDITAFQISNPGTGPVSWSAERHNEQEVEFQEWELIDSEYINDNVRNNRLEAIAFAGDEYFIAGSDNNDDNPLYVLDRDFRLVRTYEQFSNTSAGYLEITWDGELFWAVDEDSIYGFTPDGHLREVFECPVVQPQAIAWDQENEYLWIAGNLSDYIAVDRDGEVESRIEGHQLFVRGMFYRQWDPDGYSLYLLCGYPLIEGEMYKVDISSGDSLGVAGFDHDAFGSPKSSFLSMDYSQMSFSVMTLLSQNHSDQLRIYHLSNYIEWMSLVEYSGEIEAGDSLEMLLTVNPRYIPFDAISGEIVFLHNAFNGTTSLPVELAIAPNAANSDIILHPSAFSLSTPYPNPFNSTLHIEYSLDRVGEISLKLYDLSGREVIALDEGVRKSGIHSWTLDAGDLASGVYLVRLESAAQTISRKIVLMR